MNPEVRRGLWIVGGVALFVVTLLIIVYNGWGVSDKTLFDWLDIAIFPLALVLFGFGLNRAQDRRDREMEKRRRDRELEVEDQRAQDAALQAYLNQMGQLLLDKDRPLRQSEEGDEVRMLARAQTLTVLTRVDSGRRKRSILQFLYESGLIAKDRPVVDLAGADLREADLRGLDLHEAHLRRADLRWATLEWANLRGVDLREAHLREAHWVLADLREADLRGAYMWSVKGMANEELERQASSLEGAFMPNGQKYEDWLKDKNSHGEGGENAPS